MTYQVGQKVKFRQEKQRYTVQAADERHVICTKPFNAVNSVLYTILDLEDGVRGPVGLTFNDYDFSDQAECERCLHDLKSNTVTVSRRRSIPLDVESIE